MTKEYDQLVYPDSGSYIIKQILKHFSPFYSNSKDTVHYVPIDGEQQKKFATIKECREFLQKRFGLNVDITMV